MCTFEVISPTAFQIMLVCACVSMCLSRCLCGYCLFFCIPCCPLQMFSSPPSLKRPPLFPCHTQSIPPFLLLLLSCFPATSLVLGFLIIIFKSISISFFFYSTYSETFELHTSLPRFKFSVIISLYKASAASKYCIKVCVLVIFLIAVLRHHSQVNLEKCLL